MWADALSAHSEGIRLEVYEAIIKYATTKELSELSPISQMAFSFIREEIDRNEAKYTETVERNRANGAKGGRPSKPKKPTGFSETHRFLEKPKKADNDYDSDYDSDIIPPIVPPLGKEAEDAAEDNSLSWKTDYQIYLSELRQAYRLALGDKKWMEQRELYHPALDIELSLQKAMTDFWATELGWKRKRSSRSASIDWPRTFANALTLASNQVRKPYSQNQQQSNEKTVF